MRTIAPLELLGAEQLSQIHDASLLILQRTGISMPLDAARYDVLADHGARVDRERQQVFFPEALVQRALRAAPARYALHGRAGSELMLDGARSYLALDGCGTRVVDLDSGTTRASTFDDLCAAARVADALPQISLVWPCVSAQDKPPAVSPLYELYGTLRNSGKHVQAMTVVDPHNARGAVEIATAVAGGAEALARRPIISSFQCSVSPLAYERAALEAALVFAAAGVPVGFANMPIACATAPATLAGTLALSNAELVAGLVLLQVFFPGAPTFYGSYATLLELRRGGLTGGGPDDFLLQAATVQLARFYGLPAAVGTFGSGAQASDWQAGYEGGVSAAVSALCGAELICGAGLLRCASTFAYEQLLLDCEIFEVVSRMAAGIVVDAETLAVEAIARVGPRSHYLADDHTLRHMRKLWRPSVVEHESFEAWVERGSPSPAQRGRDRARAILERHQPPPLPAEQQVEEILRAYEERAA